MVNKPFYKAFFLVGGEGTLEDGIGWLADLDDASKADDIEDFFVPLAAVFVEKTTVFRCVGVRTLRISRPQSDFS